MMNMVLSIVQYIVMWGLAVLFGARAMGAARRGADGAPPDRTAAAWGGLEWVALGSVAATVLVFAAWMIYMVAAHGLPANFVIQTGLRFLGWGLPLVLLACTLLWLPRAVPASPHTGALPSRPRDLAIVGVGVMMLALFVWSLVWRVVMHVLHGAPLSSVEPITVIGWLINLGGGLTCVLGGVMRRPVAAVPPLATQPEAGYVAPVSSPPAAPQPTAVWQVRTPSGDVLGAPDIDALRRAVDRGQVPLDSLVCAPGSAQWRPVREVLG